MRAIILFLGINFFWITTEYLKIKTPAIISIIFGCLLSYAVILDLVEIKK